MDFWTIKDARPGLHIDRGLQVATKRLGGGGGGRTIFHSRTVFLKAMSRLNRLVHGKT